MIFRFGYLSADKRTGIEKHGRTTTPLPGRHLFGPVPTKVCRMAIAFMEGAFCQKSGPFHAPIRPKTRPKSIWRLVT